MKIYPVVHFPEMSLWQDGMIPLPALGLAYARAGPTAHQEPKGRKWLPIGI